ncbi:MAG: hypothetical protein ACSLEW_09565 [Nocardioides sp.]
MTRFGTSVSTPTGTTFAQGVAYEEKKFGELRSFRIFDPGLPTSAAWPIRKPHVRGRVVVTSFRAMPRDVLSGAYDAQMLDFFRSAPRTGKVFWSYFHEPEPRIDDGTFTAKEYIAAWRHLTGLARRACHDNLFPTLILTGWTAHAASGRNWRTYYPGRRNISAIAFDPYNDFGNKEPTYLAPKEIIGPVVKVARRAGKPWGIAEIGAELIPGDSGEGRAAWLTRVGRYLSRRGALFATYFDVDNGGSFTLRDSQSQVSWRAWVRWKGREG